MFIGFLLVIAGTLLILARADVIPGDVWDYLFPIALIALGAKMVFDHKKKVQ